MNFLRLFVLAGLLVVANDAKAVCGSAYPDTLPGGRINVGTFGSIFTVLAAGDVNYTNDTFTGPSFVQGNIGVGGKANFSMSDGEIDGDLYMNSFGRFSMSGPAHFSAGHGVKNNQDTVLNQALTDAQNLSDAACGETPSAQYASITNVNITNSSQSMTIMGGPNQKIVLSLQNFVMSAGTFTLQGTTTTTFIINIKNQFSLNNAKILLADPSGTVGSPGGVQASNVLFNILSSGQQISLNQGTQMSGILLALHDKVSLSGGKVFGRVIGDQVNITSGGQVISQ
jgi:hypothetical protein